MRFGNGWVPLYWQTDRQTDTVFCASTLLKPKGEFVSLQPYHIRSDWIVGPTSPQLNAKQKKFTLLSHVNQGCGVIPIIDYKINFRYYLLAMESRIRTRGKVRMKTTAQWVCTHFVATINHVSVPCEAKIYGIAVTVCLHMGHMLKLSPQVKRFGHTSIQWSVNCVTFDSSFVCIGI